MRGYDVDIAVTAGVPMTIPYFSFVVGFGLITVVAVVQVLRGVTSGPKGPGTAA